MKFVLYYRDSINETLITRNGIRCMYIMNDKCVNFYCSDMIALSRKPSRSNSTNPCSIRVYNFNYTNFP